MVNRRGFQALSGVHIPHLPRTRGDGTMKRMHQARLHQTRLHPTRMAPATLLLLLCAGLFLGSPVQAHAPGAYGDRGDRIERRWDARGDAIDRRLDRASARHAAHGHPRHATRLDRRGDRIDRRFDRIGARREARFDRRH
jgi:hypothetical protein